MNKKMLVLAGALGAAAVMVTVSAAAGGAPGTFSSTENARATAVESQSST